MKNFSLLYFIIIKIQVDARVRTRVCAKKQKKTDGTDWTTIVECQMRQ